MLNTIAMITRSVLVLLVCAFLVSPSFGLVGRVSRSQPREECSVPFSANQSRVMQEAFEKVKVRRQTSSYVFDVYFNVVAANFTYAGGWVPDTQITAQMEALNKGYAGTGIQFRHVDTIRILSSRYFHDMNVPNTAEMEQMIYEYGSVFRKGGSKTLNVNLIGFSTDDSDTYGFGILPSLYSTSPQLDGVYVRYNSLPGGSSPYRQGSTVVHEGGHWLGLLHTFQDGCDGDGDGVADTPAEASPASGCPKGRDTCTEPGLDPIHNFMDYSDEDCRNSFTEGQIARMHSAILAYRS